MRRRTPHQCARPDPRGGNSSSLVDSDTLDILDNFWEARGVFDPEQRAKLAEVALKVRDSGEEASGDSEVLVDGDALPGVTTTWELESRAKQVRARMHPSGRTPLSNG